MRILAFDPGHSTGFALVEDGKILMSGTVDHAYNCFTDLIDMIRPDAVALEDIPTMTADRITRDVFSIIKQAKATWTDESVKLFIVKPGVWKPLRKAKNKGFIAHVQDAIGLAEYAERISKDA